MAELHAVPDPVNFPENVVQIAGRGGFGGEGVSPSPPYQNLLPAQKVSTIGKAGSNEELTIGRKRNEVWDACVEVLGYEPLTVSEKRLWGRMTTSLRGAEATRERIVAVAEYYEKKWPGIDLTITAIEKWYSHFLSMKNKRESGLVAASARVTPSDVMRQAQRLDADGR